MQQSVSDEATCQKSGLQQQLHHQQQQQGSQEAAVPAPAVQKRPQSQQQCEEDTEEGEMNVVKNKWRETIMSGKIRVNECLL